MKTFSVRNFNKTVNNVIKNASKEQKANIRMSMLYKAIKYSVKGGAK